MIPSLLQIPSAVSDSKLHSVLPNNGKGDFQFERSTGATRINKDGLIEEVGYFSSELVQNGNFSELGSELVTNGDFATNSDWNLGTGWSINNGKAVGENAGSPSVSYLSQDFAFVSGKTYKVVYTVSEYVKGNVRPQLASPGSQNLPNVSANGTYTEYIVANNNFSKFRFRAATTDGGFTGKIDNVSVKQVDPNDRWTAYETSTSTVSKEFGVIRIDLNSSNSNAGAYQENVFENGKDYKILITAKGSASFNMSVLESNGASTVASIGEPSLTTEYQDFLFNYTGTGNHDIFLHRLSSALSANQSIFIKSVSIVEVQGDRPRLSYDITNGVVEDKPHLLLENSSTNLVKFSENFTQWTLGSNAILTFESDIEAPDGTLGVYRLKLPATGSTFIQSNSFSSSNPLSVSIYAKATGTGDDNFNLYTGGSNISPLKTATDKWQRFEYTASGTNFFLINSGDSFITDIYIWGAQAEALSYATSLIPTAGTTITRAAETCNNSKPSVNSTEGVLYCEIAALANDGTFRQLTISDSSTSDRVSIDFTSTNNQIRSFCSSGGGTVANMTGSVTDATQFNKVAVKYKLNDYALYINGSEVATDTSGAAPVGLQEIAFNNGGGSNIFYGKVKGLAVYNEELTDAQLITLTS